MVLIYTYFLGIFLVLLCHLHCLIFQCLSVIKRVVGPGSGRGCEEEVSEGRKEEKGLRKK